MNQTTSDKKKTSAMNYQDLLKEVAGHVILLFIQNPDERRYYHNLTHVAGLVEAAKKINAYHQVDERENFITSTALWFLDTGIIFEGMGFHQTKSAELVENFLKTQGVDDGTIDEIKNCLLATSLPQKAVSLTEKIVCDAQIFYCGTPTFKEETRLLRKEAEALTGTTISNMEWRAQTIELLENSHYLTDYCRLTLNKTKEENLSALKIKHEIKMRKENSVAGKLTDDLIALKAVELNERTDDYVKQLKKSKHHLRGVQTMFKNSSSNHQRLSVMADNKAFIMISVNSIIISVAIGLYIGKLVQKSNLVLPTILLLGVSVVAIIYSVLATRPNIPNGTFTREQIDQKTVNLLFFGSFYKMDLPEFEYGIKQMMNDSEFLYGSLIKDIYGQGRILGRKFRLLRISYNVFMYGMAISVIAYIVAAFF